MLVLHSDWVLLLGARSSFVSFLSAARGAFVRRGGRARFCRASSGRTGGGHRVFYDVARRSGEGSWAGIGAITPPKKNDNRENLARIARHNPKARIGIFHGMADNDIPVEMVRELAREFP